MDILKNGTGASLTMTMPGKPVEARMVNVDGPVTAAMRNSAFSTLLCATLSLLILQMLAFRQGLPLASYAVATLVNTAMTGFILRRVLSYCVPPNPTDHSKPHAAVARSGLSIGGRCLLMATLGHVSFAVILGGWITPLALLAPVLICMRWGTLVAQRRDCIACWSATLAGSVSAVVFSDAQLTPITLPAACWLFWMCTTVSWLRLLALTRSWQLARPLTSEGN